MIGESHIKTKYWKSPIVNKSCEGKLKESKYPKALEVNGFEVKQSLKFV